MTLCREQVPSRRRCRPIRAILRYCNRVRDISGPSHASAGFHHSVHHDSLDRRDIWSKGQTVSQPHLRVFRRVLFSYLDVMSTVFCRTCNQVEPHLLQTEKICHIYVCQYQQIYQPHHVKDNPNTKQPTTMYNHYVQKKMFSNVFFFYSSWNHHGS